MIQLLIFIGILIVVIVLLLWRNNHLNKSNQFLLLKNEKLLQDIKKKNVVDQLKILNKISFWTWDFAKNTLICDENFFTDLGIPYESSYTTLSLWEKAFVSDDFQLFLKNKEQICASNLYGDTFELVLLANKGKKSQVQYFVRASVSEREPFGKALCLKGLFFVLPDSIEKKQ